MQFQPKSEKQIAEEKLLPAGVYPFEVLAAESKKSKAGNDMIELKLRLFRPDGSEWNARDWLMEKIPHKLFHFCSFTGLSTKYHEGALLSTDCIGKSGYAKIVIKEDKEGKFPPSNSVADYVRAPEGDGSGMKRDGVMPKPQPTAAQLANQADATPDDVPY